MNINQSEMSIRLHALWSNYAQDLNRATFQLFALLKATELINRGATHAELIPSHLDIFPQVPDQNVTKSTNPGGEVQQLAYKGWVAEVNRLWEDKYRPELRNIFKASGVTNTIDPLSQLMGDFNLVRNDFIHGSGTSSRRGAGRCQELKWFKSGQSIVLTTSHVFDFLSRFGALTWSSWSLAPTPRLLARHPSPRIVCCLAGVETESDSGELYGYVRLIFENGLYREFYSTGMANTPENRETLRLEVESARITQGGDLEGDAEWLNLKASDIYRTVVLFLDKLRQNPDQEDNQKGFIYGPSIQIRVHDPD